MRDTIRKSRNRWVPRKAGTHAQGARMDAARARAADALRRNCCPSCSRTVRTNSALTGWVQCSQFGAPEFRADPSQPACDWQGFT